MDTRVPPTGSRPPARSAGRYLWWAHAALLVFIVGYIGVSSLHTGPDANIGLGFGLLALGVTGLPWTLPIFLHGGITTTSALFVVVAAGASLLNLVLHALVWRSSWVRPGRGSPH